MKIKIILLLMILLTIITISANAAEVKKTEEKTCPDVKTFLKDLKVSISTDKELYHSGETIQAKVIINSGCSIKNVYTKVYGIYASRHRIEEYRKVDLQEGENILNFSFTTPSCYGCAGIQPGKYDVAIDIAPIILTNTKNIDIQQ